MKISIIGDSIRMQYENRVKELLGEEHECFSPTENCRFAKYNLRGMWDWKIGMIGSRVVHWNCGLWDICEIFGEGLFTSLEEYTATVLRIADILLSRHERVIFATTTPVREENPYNKNADIIRYNEAIVPHLREKGVIINDLHPLIYEDVNRFVSDDLIHLSEDGVELCARQTARIILDAIRSLDGVEDTSVRDYDEKTGAPVRFKN